MSINGPSYGGPFAKLETAMAEAKKEKDEVVFIRTVFGDMVDPTNNQRYTTEGQKVVMTPWVKIQAEAGKIVFE